MLRHLIRKEILDHLLSFRFLILSVLGALLIWVSLYSGWDYYRDSVTSYRLSQTWTESHIQHLAQSGDLTDAGNFGYPFQKPPTPMSIFVRGMEPTLGRTGYMAFIDIRRLKFSAVSEEPILGLFPPLDLGLVVQVIFGLFALLLTYDSICGEKEGGTLRLVSSFTVPRYRLLLGKVLGALIPTLTAFALPLLLGVGVLLLLPDVQIQPPDRVRLGLMFGAFILYLTAFICAGVCGSCLTHRAAGSFVILLFFWVATVTILPRLSLIVADVIRVAPSTQRFRADINALGQANNHKRYEIRRQWVREFLGKTGKNWWETKEGRDGFASNESKVREEVGLKNRAEVKQLEEAFRNRYNARLSLAVDLARFSPAFALNNAVVRLAGTGADRHQRFLGVLNRLRIDLSDWYWEKNINRIRDPGKYDSQSLSDIPRVIYRETWPGEDVQAALLDIGVLALWGILLFVGSYAAILRYDLR